MLRYLVATMLLTGGAVSHAGEYNQVLSPGDTAPTWKDLPGTDGKKHSLSDLKDVKLVVVVFTCNSCPIARDYEQRLIDFAKKYEDKLGVVAINVNTIPEDSLPKMKERAEKLKFPFPYLFDKTQQIARDYGASGTPEFFLLSRDRKIVYMGAMDDDTTGAKVTTRYLEEAVLAALAGESPKVTETFANGCRIRFARRSRNRPSRDR